MITHAPVLGGSTDYSCLIRVIDSTDGTPETGFAHDTSGIDLWYRRGARGAVTSITEAALAAPDSAHTDGGVEHVGNGYVRVDLPDAAVATGVECVQVGGTATGMVVIGAIIPIVAYNGADGVRLGLTALPNAAADAAGGLPISDAGGLDLDAQIGTDIDAILADTAVIGAPAGASVSADIAAVKIDTAAILVDTGTTLDGKIDTIDTNVDAILVDTAEIGAAGAGLTNINLPNQTMDITGNITGNLSGSVGSVTGNVGGDVVGEVGSIGTGGIADTSFAAGAINAAAIAANAIGASEIAADAIDASALAADAVAEIADGIWDEATSGHATAGTYGDKLGAHLPAVLKVIIGSGSTTTAVELNATTGIDGGAPSAVADFYNGRVLIFTSGALAGQATSISDYDGSNTLTVVALTGAPAADVTAVIV